MRNDFPKLIIGVITTALLGLVGIQFYWIKNAVELKEQEFQQSIARILMTVSSRVERNEAISFIESHRLSGTLLNNRMSYNLNQQSQIDTVDDFGNRVIIDINNQVTPKKSHQSIQIIDENGHPLAQSNNFIDYFKQVRINSRENVFKQVLIDFLQKNPNPNVLERLDLDKIQHNLSVLLSESGIDAVFHFGIISPNKNLVFIPEDIPQSKLINSPYQVRLFPNDYSNNPNYLSVYFPRHRGYLLSSMSGIMFVSLIFIIAICWTFWYSIKTIYSQKKVAVVKNDFINNMTHELKTPISTISLACQMLGDPSFEKSQKNRGHYIKMIADENLRLSTLVERVLQSAVLDKGSFKIKKEELSINSLLNQAIDSSQVKANANGGRIIAQLEADMDEYAVDKVHMTNVFYNLLDNAIKYSKYEPEVVVYTKNQGNDLIIGVMDNGIGINSTDQTKIFDKLYRVPTGNLHDVKGFGLGLSYVKAILDKHQAKIKVDSKLGKGTTFEVKLIKNTLNT
ncbi:HAMP domain-containing histidine kinase [Flavobacteriales bacterium]|jgi:two-component system phosphate regulon sensor histidine kinase PhoR|nr:HAMP domain-containing histidine kinase [Flavobacteriales bacterium]